MLLEGRRIAIIEDDPIMGESLIQSLNLEGAKVTLFGSGRAAKDGAALGDLDLIICDIRLPDTDGHSLFNDLGRHVDAPPFLFMTAYGEIDQAVELMREGAADYLTKPFDMDVFLRRVQGSLRPPSAGTDAGALGVSRAMREVETLLRRVSGIDSPVLITGETGTGKEVCARFLHRISKRAGPFMAVNCAAIPAELLESELFGHEAGAFTGASRRHLGYVERAKAGTLFLDEIGELALPMQAKLLRLVEDRHFFRLGGEVAIPFKARLVSATNADLNALMAAKQFRSDLYYRINVVELRVPPLSDRREDIPWLISHFIAHYAPDADRPAGRVSASGEQAAMAHQWRGNIRELRNRVERAIALGSGGPITAQDLFPEKRFPEEAGCRPPMSLADARETAERQQIAFVLAENQGQIGRTAEALGISRTTLWEKMKRYGLTES